MFVQRTDFVASAGTHLQLLKLFHRPWEYISWEVFCPDHPYQDSLEIV